MFQALETNQIKINENLFIRSPFSDIFPIVEQADIAKNIATSTSEKILCALLLPVN